MREKRRMTAVEFEALRPLLTISAERIEAARLALVEGQTLAAVGEKFGFTRQAAGDAVSVVWKRLEDYHEAQRVTASAGALLPPGWEQVTLIAPTPLVAKFRAEIAQWAPPPKAKKTPQKTAKPPASKGRAGTKKSPA